MAKIKRKTVCDSVDVDRDSLCEGGLIGVREYVDSLIEQYGEDARLELLWNYEDFDVMIRFERLETEKEAEKRIAKARKVRAQRKADKLKKEEFERDLFAKLKKKYGDR